MERTLSNLIVALISDILLAIFEGRGLFQPLSFDPSCFTVLTPWIEELQWIYFLLLKHDLHSEAA